MSGNLSKTIHEKKIVRYTVTWSNSDSLNWSRQFKSSIAAVRCRNEKIKKRFENVGMFRNTKIYKTEKLF